MLKDITLQYLRKSQSEIYYKMKILWLVWKTIQCVFGIKRYLSYINNKMWILSKAEIFWTHFI